MPCEGGGAGQHEHHGGHPHNHHHHKSLCPVICRSKSFKLIFQLVLTTAFFFVELTVGYIGGSLALVADSFHMLSDVISLMVGLFAVRIARKRTPKNTFGWVRAEVLGALVNSVFLIALCFTIFIEAIKRFVEPEFVSKPSLVLYVGIGGLFINAVGLFLFSHNHSHSHSHPHGHGHGPTVAAAQTLKKETLSDVEEIASDETADILPATLGSEGIEAPSFTCFFCRNSGFVDPACANCGTDPPGQQGDNILPLNSRELKQVNEGLTGLETSVTSQKERKPKHSEHMNMRGVFLHILGDFLGSIVVCVVAGTLMLCKAYAPVCGSESCHNDNDVRCVDATPAPGALCSAPCWTLYLDPALSIFMLIIILSSTIPLLKDSAFILLQTVPTHIEIDRVQKDLLRKIPSIRGIHEFHVWQLAGNRIIASAHVQCHSLAEYDQMAADIKAYFHEKGIHSTTIQPEFIESQQAASSSGGPRYLSNLRNDNSQVPPSQTCLIVCGPEKSCGDQEVCCPRLNPDQPNSLKRRTCSSMCSLDAGGGGNELMCCDNSIHPAGDPTCPGGGGAPVPSVTAIDNQSTKHQLRNAAADDSTDA